MVLENFHINRLAHMLMPVTLPTSFIFYFLTICNFIAFCMGS